MAAGLAFFVSGCGDHTDYKPTREQQRAVSALTTNTLRVFYMTSGLPDRTHPHTRR